MTADEANSYIDLPWVSGGRGPASFDCWGLLLWVQRLHFGIQLPERAGSPDEMRALYRGELQSGRWRIAPRPLHGCGALLRAGDQPHVGVYLCHDGGGVLHATEGVGVIFTPRQYLRSMGYPRVTWYEFLQCNDSPRA